MNRPAAFVTDEHAKIIGKLFAWSTASALGAGMMFALGWNATGFIVAWWCLMCTLNLCVEDIVHRLKDGR